MLDVWTITEVMDVCATQDMKVMEEYAEVSTIFYPKVSIYFSDVWNVFISSLFLHTS